MSYQGNSPTNSDALHDELQYFIANQEELLKSYWGKVLAIKNQEIIGVFDSPLEAYLRTQEKYELGTFLIQACEPGRSAYTVSISTLELAV